MEEKVVHTTVAGVSYQCEVIARRKFTMTQQLSCQSCSPITAQLPLLTLQVLLPQAAVLPPVSASSSLASDSKPAPTVPSNKRKEGGHSPKSDHEGSARAKSVRL